jgi:hypothetical protein
VEIAIPPKISPFDRDDLAGENTSTLRAETSPLLKGIHIHSARSIECIEDEEG